VKTGSKRLFTITTLIMTSIILAGYVLPDRVYIMRETIIDASQEEIFHLVSDYRAWKSWCRWLNGDTHTRFIILGSGIGQRMSWQSERPVLGSGTQEIAELQSPQRLVSTVSHETIGSGQASILIDDIDGKTRVRWIYEKNMRNGVAFWMQPTATYAGYFMDIMVGPNYEAGLKDLKSYAEINPTNN